MNLQEDYHTRVRVRGKIDRRKKKKKGINIKKILIIKSKNFGRELCSGEKLCRWELLVYCFKVIEKLLSNFFLLNSTYDLQVK